MTLPAAPIEMDDDATCSNHDKMFSIYILLSINNIILVPEI